MAFLDDAGLVKLWQHIQARLSNKVDKVAGKGLSSNDFTDEDKEKIASLKDNAQPDWNVNDENDPAYVKNRTHYEIETNRIIEWDGNTEGLVRAGDRFYKVSDYIPTDEELLGGTLTILDLNGEFGMPPFLVERTVEDNGFINYDDNFRAFLIFDQIHGFIVAKQDNVIGPYDEILLPEKGIYFLSLGGGPASLTLNSKEVKQLDEKYIPDTIARVNDIEAITIDLTGNEITDAVLTNADLLAGKAASEYATVNYVDSKLDNIQPSGTYATMRRINTTVLASKWEQASSGEHTQLVEIEDMSPHSKCYHIDVDMTNATKDDALSVKLAWSYVDKAETATNGILLTAFTEVPTIDFNIVVDVETMITDIPNVAGVDF